MSTLPTQSAQVKVLVTGFGPFLDITTNPSWEIARQLPKALTTGSGQNFNIVVPAEPTPAAYHKIHAQLPQLYEQHEPDLIVHIGLDVDSGAGVFKVERSAPKEGFHDIPDIDRKVFTRAENKKIFGKGPASLVTTLDVESAHTMWRQGCSSLSLARGTSVKKSDKSKNKQIVSVELSDDVGTYVCGFQYYASMLEMQKRNQKRHVVFFHVPMLNTEEEIKVGIQVTEELIKALVDASEEDA